MSYSIRTLFKATAWAALVVVLSITLVLGVVACGDDDSSATTQVPVTTAPDGTATTDGSSAALVGKWYCERIKETIEFTADGNMIWTKDGDAPLTFTYTVEAGNIVFLQPNAPEENRLPFTVEGGSMTTVDPKYGRLNYVKQ